MKKLLLIAVSFALFIACSSKKQIEKALHSGNYDLAIEDALRKLETHKDKDRKQDFVILLQEAYQKAVARDEADIKHLKKDGNPERYQTVYEKYLDLNARQEAIKPYLPLQIAGQTLDLVFKDYTDELIASRNKLAIYMYDQGLALLTTDDKMKIRQAYDLFQYIESIHPNFKNSRNLMAEAHQRGIHFVLVSIENKTNQIIPQGLEDELLDFDTYGLDQFWTVYHAYADAAIAYDYSMQLQVKRINISPEELHEKQLLKEKQIVDGWQYQLDDAGNVVKDSLGNDIKIEKLIHVRARYVEFKQLKSTQLIGKVVFFDLKNGQTLDAFPIESEFIFQNSYATIRGDQRALDRNELQLTNKRFIHFPTNEQMVFDTGENLKLKLKNIISSFRWIAT